MFERRYASGMSSMRGTGRDFGPPPPPLGRREALPPLPPLGRSGMGGGAMRSPSGYDAMFSRRASPPAGRGRFGVYEDFSRDSFDVRGMRGPSPTHRYAPY